MRQPRLVLEVLGPSHLDTAHKRWRMGGKSLALGIVLRRRLLLRT